MSSMTFETFQSKSWQKTSILYFSLKLFYIKNVNIFVVNRDSQKVKMKTKISSVGQNDAVLIQSNSDGLFWNVFYILMNFKKSLYQVH